MGCAAGSSEGKGREGREKAHVAVAAAATRPHAVADGDSVTES